MTANALRLLELMGRTGIFCIDAHQHLPLLAAAACNASWLHYRGKCYLKWIHYRGKLIVETSIGTVDGWMQISPWPLGSQKPGR